MQSDDPALVRRAAALTRDASRVDEMTWSLYQYAASFLRNESAEAPDDAAAVWCRAREPSGRAPLGGPAPKRRIPARLVGGPEEDAAGAPPLRVSLGRGNGRRSSSNGHCDAPANYLALYTAPPLIEHGRLGFRYDMLIHQVTRQALLRRGRAAEHDHHRVRG
jgi:hypothetical protein